ncbi:MAG: Hsp20/alpha crystallin family protein [Clostridia bacterium]|nr:Hsp20/alpha crystallin family protein [Deltaproteobacteria bacterium]
MQTEVTTAAQDTATTDNEQYFVPRTDVYETGEALIIAVDVPGASESSVNVSLEGEKLCLEAKITASQPPGFTLTHQEYRVGNYRRTFSVHTLIDRDAITASLADGVLTVTLPKAKEAKLKRIEVKAER